MSELYMGIMSGSSCDGVDAVIANCCDTIGVLERIHQPYPHDLQNQLLQLLQPQPNEIHLMASLDVKLGHFFADVVLKLLKEAKISSENIKAIGCHGQTIRHNPNNKYPYTIQIGDGNIIAATTNITTVSDFRRRDIALGGQGAPLAPLFHQKIFAQNQSAWVCNVGGIANLSYIDQHMGVQCGFDTGPGNALLDSWYQKHHNHPYDDQGQWAAAGQCHEPLLTDMLQDPYFQLIPPKSTGRDYFHLEWLQQYLEKYQHICAQDIQTTLTYVTAQSIIDALSIQNRGATKLWLCGGGTYNLYLMHILQQLAPQLQCLSSQICGISPQDVEALGFAWLAQQCMHGLPGNSPQSTGASTETILGSIYPAYSSAHIFKYPQLKKEHAAESQK